MIRAVTFDFWGTLYADERQTLEESRTSVRVKRLQSYLKRTPHADCAGSIEETFHNTWQMFRDLRDQGEVVQPRELVLAMGDEIGVEFTPEEVDEMTTLLEEAAIDLPPHPMKHALDTVSKLSHSYKLAIIADTGLTPGHVLRRVMANDTILSFFESFAFSNETLYTKPHPELFLQVLDELEVDPDEAVHVGDLAEMDVKGARSVGMKTILFSQNDNPFRTETEADACIDDLKKIPAVLGMFSEKKNVHRSH